MTANEAQNMIASANFSFQPQTWLDLGCGSGIFTLALAELLPVGSKVIGVDKSFQNLPKQSTNGNKVEFIQSDILDFKRTEKINGVLMANSLHYVKNQVDFTESLKLLMPKNFNLILVEYDSEISNPWVPFPVSMRQLENLFRKDNFSFKKLGERKSIYNQNKMYVVEIMTNKQLRINNYE